jgi:hypothetical protein
MESMKPPRRTLFVLLWGVLGFGGGTALLATVVDWHAARHLTPAHIVFRFVIYMALGIVYGRFLWDRVTNTDYKKLSRTQTIVRSVLFIGLMLGLGFILWTMIRR